MDFLHSAKTFARLNLNTSSKLSPVPLAETLKRYHKSPVFRLDYNFIRVEIPPLTSEMKYDILLAFFGGKQIEPPSYRKEEVMSQMDSLDLQTLCGIPPR
jgi:hypothetical protein